MVSGEDAGANCLLHLGYSRISECSERRPGASGAALQPFLQGAGALQVFGVGAMLGTGYLC
jgi:hypothetical protein